MNKTTFIAAGDSFPTRRLPEDGYEGFAQLQECILNHDVRFLNLESTFHDQEGYPAVQSGGTWAMSDPRMLDDMCEYGFNLFNTANNHSGDYGEGGVLATIDNLKARDMLFAGTGKNLGDANRACYLETKNARVALIACSAVTGKAPAMAGDATRDMIGRPGLNPLRYNEIFHVDQAHFDMAKELATASGMNRITERSIRNGFTPPPKEGTLSLGGKPFILDDHCWVESAVNEQDMQRIEAEIQEAKRQADIVLVSIHNHFIDGSDNFDPPKFLKDFAHRCIDAGASAIIGHGPHELQGIELYNGGLILYSVGNFIFETDTVSHQPWDAFANRKLPADTKVGHYMDIRSKNGTAGYCTQWPIWNAVMAAWTMEGDQLTQVQLYPIELGMEKKRSQRGVPVMNGSEKTLEYLQKLSAPFGTNIEIKDGIGYINVK